MLLAVVAFAVVVLGGIRAFDGTGGLSLRQRVTGWTSGARGPGAADERETSC